MNTWLENRAEEVRIEVDLIVGQPRSFAGEEAKRDYKLAVERGTEHWHAREQAILGAADTLLSRAQVAVFSDPAVADRHVVHASRLQKALLRDKPMADAVRTPSRESA